MAIVTRRLIFSGCCICRFLAVWDSHSEYLAPSVFASNALPQTDSGDFRLTAGIRHGASIDNKILGVLNIYNFDVYT